MKVAAAGWAKKTARVSGGGVGGALGGEIAAAKIGSKGEESMPAQTPAVGRAGWLALADSELALARMKGLVTLKPVEVVTRIPRSEVVSAELGKGVVAPLTIRFAGGEIWQFEVAKVAQKDAGAVADAQRYRKARLTRA